ncbi:hypothetical protein LWC34_10215 [Kibdelosporangium philippinense]|uniref:DUF5667 domain-containing protein n=1 Tax=Kibdelosporangium philippinense TaxID=211113 RepID=A0ABS8Z719_9PSEU|nr:hypothetical protein [Kibdelosporangium philippinense]MCE7003202.1 hypothetical protein [Kibdelosporangium philippinense]
MVVPAESEHRSSPLTQWAIGVVIGAAVVGLLWLVTTDFSSPSGAAGDAAAACAALDRVGDLKPMTGRADRLPESNYTLTAADRLSAAKALAQAAARDDSTYKVFSETVGRADELINRRLRLTTESIGELDRARNQCANF